MRQTNAGFWRMPLADIIRPAMSDGIRHLPEQIGIKPSLETCNTIHIDLLRIPGCTLMVFF